MTKHCFVNLTQQCCVNPARVAIDRSYGIEVAKLAGLPKPLTDRAYEILKELESELKISKD